MTILDREVVSIGLIQWHWKVFLNIEYWWYLDIPNLRNVNLPSYSFENVRWKSISSSDWLIDLISFIDVSPILADRVEIKDDSDSDSDPDFYSDYSLIRNISMEWLFVCFKPILDPNAWFYYYQNINPVCLIMLFSLPFLQWYWIRIDVSINQPFTSKITMLFTNDPSIIYWTFTNDDGCNLPIIIKKWFE